MKKIITLTAFAFCISIKAQVLTIVAGNGNAGYSGDGGQATAAELNDSWRIEIDNTGDLIIADNSNNRVRKVGSNGIITTIAGNGIQGYSGDGGQATAAELSYPEAYRQDYAGNAYVADYDNNVIRKINSNGIISTCAGITGVGTYGGDGGLATNANLYEPWEMAFDHQGNMYIADNGNNRIRMVNSNGIINTYAGNGTSAYSGDGGSATAASLFYPVDVLLDAFGNLYIADSHNNAIRKVSTNGIITTIAGNGTVGYTGDGGLATNATLSNPFGIDFDSQGNLYIADNGNSAIRKVSTNGIITTVVNSSNGLFSPYDVAIDNLDNLYIDDPFNSNVVYKVNLNTLSIKQETSINTQVSIYPNPTNSIINLSISQYDNLKMQDVEVTNVLGEVVYHSQIASSPNCQIDVSALPAGVYFIRAGTSTQKFVKE